jgi:hypothetical protein
LFIQEKSVILISYSLLKYMNTSSDSTSTITLASSVALFQQPDLAELWTFFSPVILQLKEMQDFYREYPKKNQMDYDLILQLERIIEKSLPDLLKSYTQLPLSGRQTEIIQHNKTAWQFLQDNLILLKEEVRTLYEQFFQQQGKTLAILYRKNQYYQPLPSNHSETRNNLNMPEKSVMNEQEIYALFQPYYLEQNKAIAISDNKITPLSQWQGLSPLQFLSITTVIAVLLLVLVLALT